MWSRPAHPLRSGWTSARGMVPIRGTSLPLVPTKGVVHSRVRFSIACGYTGTSMHDTHTKHNEPDTMVSDKLPVHDAARRLRPSCGVEGNAAIVTSARRQGLELRSSDGAPSGPGVAAAAPIGALFLHQQAPPSPVPAPMAGGDQHTDQDAAAGEGAPQKATNAGAHAIEDAGSQVAGVGERAASPPMGPLADADDAHVRVELMAAAKAAEDVSSVLLRSAGVLSFGVLKSAWPETVLPCPGGNAKYPTELRLSQGYVNAGSPHCEQGGA